MAKNKNASNRMFPQFKRQIPEMPEGYYSSGPNPNLRRFIEEHAKPYDPETDDYRVKPFDQPITTTKATAIYNMHTYWSKKPHDAIRQYIKHYTRPGDIVLDPFCGSGGTALAALMEGRAAVAIDLSPAATFITKNYCTPVDVDELQEAFEALKCKVRPEMDWLYETRCDRCDGRATTAYMVYSSVYQCQRCLAKVPLFDCVEALGETKSGKSKKIRVCPHCHERGILEEIKTTQEKFGSIPVMVSYLCQEGCRPQRDQRMHNDPNPKKRAYFQQYDLGKIAEVEEREIPYWYPEAELAEKIPYRMLHKKDFRPSDAIKLTDLFTKRNLWALAAIINLIRTLDSQPSQDIILFGLSGILLGMSRMNRYRPGVSYPLNILNGTYYLPQIGQEEYPLKHLENKISRLIIGLSDIKEQVSTNKLIIDTHSATDLSGIRVNSLDYIFTDPPYAGNIQYGELNFVWEAWLGFDTDWYGQEIIVNETRGKTDDDWAELMRQAMRECFRVLKPGRWISLCYHDTSEGTWQLVQDIMTEAGFIPEHSENALYIDTGQKSYNQLMAEKVTKRDLVINFRKPRPGELSGQLDLFEDTDFTTFQEAARLVLVEALTAHPGSSADRLYDALVSRLVRRGQFERHDFDALLRSVAEPVREARMANLFDKEPPNLFGTHETVRWYLKAGADVVDEAESAKEAAAARRLEAYMQAARTSANGDPQAALEEGVHYSDLFEQYLPVQDKPRRLLQEWLPEFFIKTPAGTWRPPADQAEREQLAALRAGGLLRRVKRFGNALLEGVPPHERDKPESAATLADWVRQCRRAGLFEIGRALYEKSGIGLAGLDEVAKLELEEDYQVCVRRS